jgi:hypothetical protein
VLNASARGRLADSGPIAIAGQSLRIGVHRRLHDALRHYEAYRPNVDLVLLEPFERDLQLFDVPLMTYGLRHEVIRRGYRTTVKTILGNFDHYAGIFEKHGIRMVARGEIELRAQRWSSAYRRVA